MHPSLAIVLVLCSGVHAARGPKAMGRIHAVGGMGRVKRASALQDGAQWYDDTQEGIYMYTFICIFACSVLVYES